MRRLPVLLAGLLLLLAACTQPAALTVTDVSPVRGGVGTELSVSGSGFASGVSVTVCGVPLADLRLSVEERRAAAPGTVGSLPGAMTLSGRVPDLGASAACRVELARPDGATVAWEGTFAFEAAEPPGNQAPTTNGLADLLVAADETARVIDLGAAFDDADDGAEALEFTYAVSAPGGNVTASLEGGELTLAFPTRLGDAAEVVVTATDPHGASVEAAFAVAFEAGRVMFAAPGLSDAQLADLAIDVSYEGDPVLTVAGNEVVLLRVGEYAFSASGREPGTYVDARLRAAETTLVTAPDALVTFRLENVPGSGRLWLAARGPDTLLALDDAALASGATTPAAATAVGTSASAVALAPDGALWVSGRGLWRIDPSELEKPEPQVTVGLTYVDGDWISNLAFDPHGNLWTAEYARSRINMFTAAQVAAGGNQTPALTLSHSAELPLTGVNALAFDVAGNLWVGTTNLRDNRIYRFDADDLSGPALRPSLTITSEYRAARHLHFAFDASGGMWYSTMNEYVGHLPAALLAATGEMTHDPRLDLKLPRLPVMSLRFDSRGNLWVVSNDGRLLTVMADDLDEAEPSTTSRALGYGADTGGFIFID